MAIDWGKGDKLIRAGILTNREIARQLECSEGAVRRRVKTAKIDRDLTAEVRKAANAKLVRSEIRKDGATDEEIIEEAATIQADVVKGHRISISARRVLVGKLYGHLESLTDGQDDIDDIIKGLMSDDKKMFERTMEKVASIPALIKGVSDLVKAEDTLIKMERVAHNISGDESEEGPKSGSWQFVAVPVKRED